MERRFEKREPKQVDFYSSGLKDLELGEVILREDLPAFLAAENIRGERIISKNNLFDSAENCKVGEVKGKIVFDKAQGCEVKKLEAEKAFFLGRGCKVGEAEAIRIFEKARDCEGGKISVIENAFLYGKNCKVKELFIIPERPLEREDIFYGAFLEAKNCEAEIVKGDKSIFERAQRCLAGEVDSENIGFFSRGVVILDDVEGRVFPSVVFIGDRIKEERGKIKEFFEKELEKAQRREESIFDILRFFDWEGETLEEGKRKLEERWEKVKDLPYLKELENYFFYFLLDNDRREKIFLEFGELSEEDQKDLLLLNYYHYLNTLERNKEYFNHLSLEDWVKLTEYLDESILSIDPEVIKEKKEEGKTIREAVFEAIEENVKREAQHNQTTPKIVKQGLKVAKEILKLEREKREGNEFA